MNYKIEDPYVNGKRLKKYIWADCNAAEIQVIARELMPPLRIAKEGEEIKATPPPLHFFRPTGRRSPWDFIEHKRMPEGKFFYEYQYDHTDGVDE